MKLAEATSDEFDGAVIENETQIHFGAPHASEPAAAEDLVRCPCGALLARWVASGLELKCRRCKRITLIPYPKRTAVTRTRRT